METNQPVRKTAAPAPKTAEQTAKKPASAPAKRAAVPGQPAKKPASAKAAEGQPVKKPVSAKSAAGQPAKKPASPAGTAPKSADSAKKPSPAGKTAANQPIKKRKKHSKKRARRIRNICIGAAALLMIAALIFHMTCAVVAGKIYPLSAGTIDLRGKGIASTRGIDRMTGLTEALLSDNGLTDVSSLANLTDCKYIDLTGNPVTPDSYASLREALPGCLILCEAEDYTVTELSLGGYELPGAEALANVFASHRALRLVDLRGTDMQQAEADSLRAQFPHISFVFSADAADTVVVNLDSAEEAAEALSRVSDAPHVTVTGCAFTPDEYRAVKAQFPGIEIDCMISVYGLALTPNAAQIDLSGVTPDGILEENLRLFGNLKSLTMGEMLPADAAQLKASLRLDELVYRYNGCTVSPETTEIDLHDAPGLSAEQLTALMEALPAVERISLAAPDEEMMKVVNEYKARTHFLFEIEAFGQTVSTGDRTVDFGGKINDGNVGELMELLSLMPQLEEALMYDSRLSRQSMDKLFDGYPEVFFGWTFRICDDRYKIRTDITAFSTQLGSPRYEFTEEDFLPLRYCKNLQALDLGHNAVSDISFLTNFPGLKVLILADNQVSDITPLASLTGLEYVELFMLYDLHDYSPLAGLESLIDLNIRCEQNERHTIDPADFMGMTSLERLWISSGHLSGEEEEQLRAALPGCNVSITESHSTGNGWRRHERYEVIERMFETRKYQPFE